MNIATPSSEGRARHATRSLCTMTVLAAGLLSAFSSGATPPLSTWQAPCSFKALDATASDHPIRAATRSPRAKSNRRIKPPPPTSSEESRSERERRLYRECAGRPNAGACEGFAH